MAGVITALGATFTANGRTGSEPITSRMVDSRSSARFGLEALTRIRPCFGAMAAKFRRENALDVSWQDTLVCNGGKQVIYNALAMLMAATIWRLASLIGAATQRIDGSLSSRSNAYPPAT